MKKSLYLPIMLLFGGALLGSCEQKAASKTVATPESTVAPKAREAVYECPMQCKGSQSTAPGKCPVCGMDLEKKS
ncbi:hypothetical protein LGH70_10455 [Hymenobacter sp. BT635]|uniref:Heavy metal binding domain-containing protein n=1 Tax=Hymenobacter nitidus TaxID=2880929 RepID=A0ABS8AEY6_9BACT|nr:heavy metal-binding domain-containing protein [Hymenobacter nitidus]MCB2378004.1 hypothetical protein [Hymenobacter nitidus]